MNHEIENPPLVVKIQMTDYTDLTTEDNEIYCRASKSTSIIYKNYIYIFGGVDSAGHYLDDFLQYDINLRAFTAIKLKTKPCARACHAACLLGDFMYIYGGTDGSHTLDDLWRFDLLHGTFERIVYETGRYRAPTLEQHCMGQLSSTELLIFGGYTSQDRLSSNYYIYSVHTNTLQAIPLNPQCPEPTVGATLTYQDQKLYLFGGYGLKGYVNELWEIGTSRRWQQVRIQKAQPLGRADHCFVPIGRDLMILYGGRNGQSQNQVLNDMWALNAKELHWRRLAEPKCGGRANCAVQAWKSKNGNFRLLLIGGISRSGQVTNISQLLIQNYNEVVKSDDFTLESVFIPNTNNINIADLSNNKINAQLAKVSPITYENVATDEFMDRSITIQRKRLQDLGLSLSAAQSEASQTTVLNLKNPQNLQMQIAGLPRQSPPQSQQHQQNVINNQLLKQIQDRLDTVIYQVNLQQDVFNDKIKSLQDIQLNQHQQFVIQQENIQKQLHQIPQQKEVNVEHTTTGRTQVQNYDEEKIVYSLQRQFDKAKQEIQLNLNKQFTEGLTQTQQELIALTKKLLNDQCSQLTADNQQLQAQIQGISGRLENFEHFSHGQFVRESQIATFQPQLEKTAENIQAINERLHSMQTLVEQQERQSAMLANQVADCCSSGSLRAGIQNAIDEVVVSLKNKVLKLEGTILDLQQENLQLQKKTPNYEIQNTSGGNVTVMNVTDEVFETKFIEMAQKNNVIMGQHEVKDLIRECFKEFKTSFESEFQMKMENQLLGLENKLSGKILQDTHQLQNKFDDFSITIQQQMKKLQDKFEQTSGSEEFVKRIEQQQVELKQLINTQTNQVKLLNAEIMQIREEMVQRSLALKASQLAVSGTNSQQLQKSTDKILEELSQRFSNALSQGPSQQINEDSKGQLEADKLAISQMDDEKSKQQQIIQSQNSLEVSMAPVRKSVRFQDEDTPDTIEKTPIDSSGAKNIQPSVEASTSSMKKSGNTEASSALRAASLVGGSYSLPEQDRIEKSLAASTAYQKQEMITKRQIRSATIEQRLFFDEAFIGEQKIKFLAADVQNNQLSYVDQQKCKVFDVSSTEVDISKPLKILQLNQNVSSMDYLGGNCYIGENTGLIKQLNIEGGAESLFVASQCIVTAIKAFGDESDQFVVFGDEDGQIGLWEPQRGQFKQLVKHEGKVIALSISQLFCVSADSTNEIIVHDVMQSTKISSIKLEIPVKCIDLAKDTLIIGSNGVVKIFKINQKKNEIVEQITLKTRKNITKCFLDQQKAILFTEDGFVQYWDLTTNDLIQQMQMTQGTPIDEACIMRNGICCAVEASCVNGVWYKD